MLDRFVIGVVRAPFGVKGHAKVQSLSGEIDHLEDLKTVLLRKGEVERRMEVEGTGGAANAFFMKFKGIDSPEEAKALTGWELVAPREAAAPLDDGEYYIEDLRGLSVLLDGARIGEINDVMDGGGTQLLEIRLDSGEMKLVPFRDEFVGDVDVAKRTAVLREGWILE